MEYLQGLNKWRGAEPPGQEGGLAPAEDVLIRRLQAMRRKSDTIEEFHKAISQLLAPRRSDGPAGGA